MNKKTTRYACLLAISRVSAILVNVFNDRVISIYSTDSYLLVKLNGIVTEDDVNKFNMCVRAVFSDFPKQPVWSINSQNDKDCPLDFSKANSSLRLSIPSVTDNI